MTIVEKLVSDIKNKNKSKMDTCNLTLSNQTLNTIAGAFSLSQSREQTVEKYILLDLI